VELPTKTAILDRLACVQGHVRAVNRMVEEEHTCLEILQQIRALQGSLRQIGILLTEHHLDQCLWKETPEDVVRARQQVKDELTALFRLHSA
jgi:CsoR family transcriptional regulator, copper-sensing transcriptional repressor